MSAATFTTRASYPYADAPRTFAAFAKPQGDPEVGIDVPLVGLIERQGASVTRMRFYTPAEAAAIADVLRDALRKLDLAGELAGQEPPRAAPRPWPYRDHRTLAEIDGVKPVAVPPVRVECPYIHRAAPVQGKCSRCGHWRLTPCKFPLCPFDTPEASSW